MQIYEICTLKDNNINYLDINSNYLYIRYDIYNITHSYLSIKYLSYKITGLIIWENKKKDDYIWKHDGLNYLSVNLKCLYTNIIHKKWSINIPVFIHFLNLVGINYINNDNRLLDININNKLLTISEFNNICNRYCNK